MPAQTANAVEFQAAVDALVGAGFSNSRAVELLTKRHELRDRFAVAALEGLVSKYNMNTPEDQQTLARMAFQLADTCLLERMQ